MNDVVHDRWVSMGDPSSSSLNAILRSPTPAARTEILWLIDFSKVAGPGEATVIILRPPSSSVLYAGDNWGEQLHWRVTLFAERHTVTYCLAISGYLLLLFHTQPPMGEPAKPWRWLHAMALTRGRFLARYISARPGPSARVQRHRPMSARLMGNRVGLSSYSLSYTGLASALLHAEESVLVKLQYSSSL